MPGWSPERTAGFPDDRGIDSRHQSPPIGPVVGARDHRQQPRRPRSLRSSSTWSTCAQNYPGICRGWVPSGGRARWAGRCRSLRIWPPELSGDDAGRPGAQAACSVCSSRCSPSRTVDGRCPGCTNVPSPGASSAPTTSSTSRRGFRSPMGRV